jgi:hypothetical protein
MHGLLQRALLILNSPQFLDSPVGKEAVQLMSDLRELYPPATDWPLQRYGPSSFVDAMEQEQFDREAVEGPFTAFHVRLYESTLGFQIALINAWNTIGQHVSLRLYRPYYVLKANIFQIFERLIRRSPSGAYFTSVMIQRLEHEFAKGIQIRDPLSRRWDTDVMVRDGPYAGHLTDELLIHFNTLDFHFGLREPLQILKDTATKAALVAAIAAVIAPRILALNVDRRQGQGVRMGGASFFLDLEAAPGLLGGLCEFLADRDLTRVYLMSASTLAAFTFSVLKRQLQSALTVEWVAARYGVLLQRQSQRVRMTPP